MVRQGSSRRGGRASATKEVPYPGSQQRPAVLFTGAGHGSFDTIQWLLGAVTAIAEGKKQTAKAMSVAAIRKQRRVCTQLV